MSELRDDPDNVDVIHEESDVNVGAIIRYGIGLLVVAAVIHVFLWWLLGSYERQNERAQTQVYPLAAGQGDRLPPFPCPMPARPAPGCDQPAAGVHR